MMTAKESTSGPRLLFVVSAPSGTGKTSLCKKLLSEVPGLSFSISHTTRAPREGEEDGKNYYFTNRDEFEQAVADGKMAEWAEIYGNCYGTARATIQQFMDQGVDVLFDIDERGAQQLREIYPDLITILILPPSIADLRKRLTGRGTETEAALRKRLTQAEEEIARMAWYQYVVVNDTLEDALDQLKAIVQAERCKHNHDFIERLLQEDDGIKK